MRLDVPKTNPAETVQPYQILFTVISMNKGKLNLPRLKGSRLFPIKSHYTTRASGAHSIETENCGYQTSRIVKVYKQRNNEREPFQLWRKYEASFPFLQ
jgi:hypothetical protein